MEHRTLEHWFTDKQGRLAAWRDWRLGLANLDLDSAHQEVATWWKFVPMVAKTFDPWRKESWPDPWELIGSGSFCPNAQGLGMFYSLVLAKIDCELMLVILEDKPRLMVLLPNKTLLNYYDGETVDMKNADFQILKTWTSSDLARLVKV